MTVGDTRAALHDMSGLRMIQALPSTDSIRRLSTRPSTELASHNGEADRSSPRLAPSVRRHRASHPHPHQRQHHANNANSTAIATKPKPKVKVIGRPKSGGLVLLCGVLASDKHLTKRYDDDYPYPYPVTSETPLSSSPSGSPRRSGSRSLEGVAMAASSVSLACLSFPLGSTAGPKPVSRCRLVASGAMTFCFGTGLPDSLMYPST